MQRCEWMVCLTRSIKASLERIAAWWQIRRQGDQLAIAQQLAGQPAGWRHIIARQWAIMLSDDAAIRADNMDKGGQRFHRANNRPPELDRRRFPGVRERCR